MDEYQVKDSGVRKEYPSGMRRDTQDGKPMYHLLSLPWLKRVAMHMTKGAVKYGENNWQKANSEEELTRFKGSAFRHLMQWLAGEDDEDHMSAVCFNLMAAEWVKDKLKTNEYKAPVWDIDPLNQYGICTNQGCDVYGCRQFDKGVERIVK